MLPVFPLAFFGSLAYYKALCQYDEVQFEVNETFPKKTLRNRCAILSPNGRLDISIPLTKPNGSKTATKDILIDYSTDWMKKFWLTLESSYASSPYYDHYIYDLSNEINDSIQGLVDLNLRANKLVQNWLHLPVITSETLSYNKDVMNDLRSDSFKDLSNESSYIQVFSAKYPFEPNLSILDALFNLGPLARNLLIN